MERRRPIPVARSAGCSVTIVRIGEIDLLPLNDGEARLPTAFYIGLDFDSHQELLADDGMIHIPIGCFLIRTGDRTVLVDAGLGTVSTSWAEGGQLPGALASAGVSPLDIDTVVCSHLHVDHVGWLADAGAERSLFPRATVRFGAADWQQFVTDAGTDDPTRRTFELLAAQDRLDPMEGDDLAIAPGLTARHTPGHTPGHYALVVASGMERAVLLGDAVECPLQLAEPDFYAMSDVDPALAARTREAMWMELEGTDTLMSAAHFPGLEFGRVLRGEGRRYFL
jgi:glyoxylase-like metal-dependent hydrolase (beta-lactamase superfamily II)